MIASQDQPKKRSSNPPDPSRPGQPARSGRWAVGLYLACVAACSTQTTSTPPGTGGASRNSSGGAIGSGGTPGTGGKANDSGGVSAGGAIGSGGIASTGGTIATGGSVATGGSTMPSDAGDAASTGGSTTGGASGGGTTTSGGVTGSGGKTGTGGTSAFGGSTGTGGGGASGPQSYTASWTSVDQHPAAPEWFQDAKFGLWHHWGAFCYPAYGSEWYPRNMFNKGSNEYNHHMSVYGDPLGNWPYSNFLTGANDKSGKLAKFAPQQVADGGSWDPDAWAQLFADAGAKMAGPVAEHHDGFSLWKSTANEWNAVDKGPNLDLVGILAKAYRAKGMKFMVSTHTAYNFTGYYQWAPAQSDPSLKKLYGQLAQSDEETLWLNKEKELIDGYQPDYMWHDFNLAQVSETARLNYLAYYYNKGVEWGKDVVVSYNDGFAGHAGEIHQEERAGEAGLSATFWLSEDTLSLTTWGYTEGMAYYSSKSLLHALIDRVSKNGFLLLNTSPMADGTFPQAQKDILLAMGAWLKVFGEAIYSTRAWVKYGEGPTQMGGGGMGAPVEGKATDIRFTRSKDNKTLYAIGLGWPTGNQMIITTLKSGSFDSSTIQAISFLGGDSCTFTQDSSGLKVSLPASASNSNGYAVKITFSGTIPTPK